MMAIFLPVRTAGGLRHHPAHLKSAVNDGALDRLDADGILVDAENASTLASAGRHDQ